MERVIKKEIFIDKQNFAKDLEKYSSKIETEKAIKCAVKNILPKYKVTDKFYDNVILNFYEAVASAYKSQNTMNIKPQQLLKILDIDTTEIERLSAKYNSLKDFKTPTIDAYITYAEYEDGISLIEDELIQFEVKNPDVISELIFENQLWL